MAGALGQDLQALRSRMLSGRTTHTSCSSQAGRPLRLQSLAVSPKPVVRQHTSLQQRCPKVALPAKHLSVRSRKPLQTCAAQGYGSDDIEAKRKNREPPTLLARMGAAIFYLVPWIDVVMIGAQYHHRFPTSIILFLIPEPFMNIYYSSQFAPLIIFFLLFLSVVKNFKLHHFTRFHCMQAIVLDIATMLFTLLRQYFPSEIRWSYLMNLYDIIAYNMCITTIIYCIFCALAGYYADITFVSESTYMQVEEG